MRRRRPAGARSRPSSSARFGSGPDEAAAARSAQHAADRRLGILSAGMGLKGFLLSSNFIDGGVTGVSMLLAKMTGAPLVDLAAAGQRRRSSWWATGTWAARSPIRSALAIAGLAGVLATMHFPDVTPDLLLTAVFGGFFIGAGIGLAVRGGGVLDGTEIAALLISKRSPLLKAGDVILIFNVVAVPRGHEGARRRAGALFDPHLRDGGEDAGLRDLRPRGVHGDHHRVEPERGDPRADHRRARAGGDGLQGLRRPHRARSRRSCTASSLGSRSARSRRSSAPSTRTRSSSRMCSPTPRAGS